MADGFFSKSAGQDRRKWLNDKASGAMGYVPPELRKWLEIADMMNPVSEIGRAGQSADKMMDPNLGGWERAAAGGDMLSSMAGVVAPVAVAKAAGMPAAQALQEAMLNASAGQRAGANYLMADESGAFGGFFAKTADHNALKRAEDMLSSGADRADIIKETGWFKGVDGKWRFEIDDSGATFKNAGDQTVSTLGDVLDHPELYKAYPDAKTTDLAVMGLDSGVRGQYMSGGRISGREAPSFGAIALANDTASGPGGKSTLMHEIQHGIQNKEGFDFGSNAELGPYQARNYAAAVKSAPDAIRARDDNWAWEGLREDGLPLWRATTLDSYENLTRRGSAGTLKPRDITGNSDWYTIGRDYVSANGQMPKKPGIARDDWLHGAAIRMRDSYLEGLGATERANMNRAIYEFPTPRDRKNAAARLDRKMDKVRTGAFEYGKIREKSAEYENLGSNKYRAHEAYMRNSGESEARNVQARLDMTPEQRAAQFPWDTTDTPFRDQIPGTAKAGQPLPDYMKSLTNPTKAQIRAWLEGQK